ncbi:efflux pump protein [Dendryphion nanum]|uniref:Efflux pump protein n=1 Tax=Dendryphion nanum TaxID=256645 RepID=A0A9P9IDT2_9PLEO|nr:efflux pump protein [Dendryphion nanum]
MTELATLTKESLAIESEAAAHDSQQASSKGTAEDVVYVQGAKLYLLLSSMTLCAFLVLLDIAIMSPAIPYITTTFQSLTDVGWYAGAYPLAHASLQPMSGKLYTHFQAKWMFLVFLFVFEIGSLICGSATSSSMLIAGRVIAGLGASGIVNGALTVIAGATPLQKRPLYTGIMLGIAFTGIVLGPLIGGALTEYASWRWCFYMNLPLGGVAALFLVFVHVPDLTVREGFSVALVKKVLPELDLIGFALFVPCAIMLLLPLQFGSEGSYAWNSATIIGLFCGCGVMTIIFVLWERHVGDRAMIPGSIVSNRVVWSGSVVNLCLMAANVVGGNFLPLYFQSVKGVGPTLSGVYLLPGILPMMVFAILSGAFVSKVGYYIPPAIFSGIFLTIGNGLISTFSPTTSVATWVGYQIVQGIGRGAGMQLGAIAIQGALSPEQIPISLAFLMFVQNLSASVFVVIGTTIFTRTFISELAIHAPSVSQQAALKAGADATAVRALVPPGSPELSGILRSLAKGFDVVYYMLVALGVVGFIFSFLMGWTDIRKVGDGKVKGEGVEEERGLKEAV